MKRLQIFILFFCLCFSAIAQDSIEVSGYTEGRALLFSEELPFWMYTNTNGFLGRESNVGVSAFAKAQYDITPSHSINLGLGGFLRDGLVDNVQRSDLYFEYQNKWVTLTAGAKSPEIARQNLSTINDNILFTGNSRALPGVLLSTTEPVKLGSHLTIKAQIAHYRLNDTRFVKDVNVHYKSLELGWDFNTRNRLTAGLRHYVQWAGTAQDGTDLPDGFKNLARVFFGQNAVNIDNPNETINALGNHIGSYELKFLGTRKHLDFEVYHHSLFDDRSGRELNNFPDGVWGLHLKPKSSNWLKGVLYEYVQTISQSGRPTSTTTDFGQQSGGDNYFVNSVYRSGWTYEGTTIGLPFIRPIGTATRPISNRSIAHHLGAYAQINQWGIKGKFTYLENLGTYSRPINPREKQLLSYAQITYDTEKLGQLLLYFGADNLSSRENNIGVGLGYRYVLQ